MSKLRLSNSTEIYEQPNTLKAIGGVQRQKINWVDTKDPINTIQTLFTELKEKTFFVVEIFNFEVLKI